MPSVPHVNVYPLRAHLRTRRLCLAIGIPLSIFASHASACLEGVREHQLSSANRDLRYLHTGVVRFGEPSPCSVEQALLAATIKERPAQDPWGGMYRAECLDPDRHDIRICTAGPDRRFDTKDDLCFDGR